MNLFLKFYLFFNEKNFFVLFINFLILFYLLLYFLYEKNYLWSKKAAAGY